MSNYPFRLLLNNIFFETTLLPRVQSSPMRTLNETSFESWLALTSAALVALSLGGSRGSGSGGVGGAAAVRGLHRRMEGQEHLGRCLSANTKAGEPGASVLGDGLASFWGWGLVWGGCLAFQEGD